MFRKIIRPNSYTFTCGYCRATITADRKDFDDRWYGKVITCPCCKKEISISTKPIDNEYVSGHYFLAEDDENIVVETADIYEADEEEEEETT